MHYESESLLQLEHLLSLFWWQRVNLLVCQIHHLLKQHLMLLCLNEHLNKKDISEELVIDNQVKLK
jgi:hypothetical protein